MRLLRCHIENFGVLSGFDYEFPEGLAVICRENGFGKSTLAAIFEGNVYGCRARRAQCDRERAQAF